MYWILFYTIAAVIIFYIAYYWDKKTKKIDDIRSFEDIEKLAEFDGDFEYHEIGFYLKLNNSRRFIKWSEIKLIIGKKFHVVRETKTVYYIKTNNEVFEIPSEKAGIYKFNIKAEENLSFYDNRFPNYNSERDEFIIYDSNNAKN